MYITHDKTLHFVGITKPKEAQLQSPAEPTQPIHKSQQLEITWADQPNFSTTKQLEPIPIKSQLVQSD